MPWRLPRRHNRVFDGHICTCSLSHVTHADISVDGSILQHYILNRLLSLLLVYASLLLTHLPDELLLTLAESLILLSKHLIIPSTLRIESPLDVNKVAVRVCLIAEVTRPVCES